MKVDDCVFPLFVLDKYTVNHKIREGSYGAVYEGKMKKNNLPVAIKVLSNIFHTI